MLLKVEGGNEQGLHIRATEFLQALCAGDGCVWSGDWGCFNVGWQTIGFLKSSPQSKTPRLEYMRGGVFSGSHGC